MADDQPASIISLHQPQRKHPKTAAERARDCRARKKAKKLAEAAAAAAITPEGNPPPPQPLLLESPPAPVSTPTPTRPSHHKIHQIGLTVAALGLGAVGVTMNGWVARSLGSGEIAGWLFLAIGVASDLVALCMPPCAARQWHAGNRATAAVAWVIWW